MIAYEWSFFPLLKILGVFIVKPVFVPHETYQNFVVDQLQKHYSGSGILVLTNSDWPVITELWMTDLSQISTLLRNQYGDRGPAPRDTASMMRSYLLLILTIPTMRITGWD